jgi:hypothetical protein
MQPRGFADSFFSPDYAAGLGVLFQKLNQVRPTLLARASDHVLISQKGVH